MEVELCGCLASVLGGTARLPVRLEQSVVWSLVDQGDVLQPRRLGEVGWGTLLSEAVGGDCLAGPPARVTGCGARTSSQHGPLACGDGVEALLPGQSSDGWSSGLVRCGAA